MIVYKFNGQKKSANLLLTIKIINIKITGIRKSFSSLIQWKYRILSVCRIESN